MLRSAWRDKTNADIAASIMGFIRRAALGDPLVPYSERVDRALAKIAQSRAWTPVQRRWLERIGKQIKADEDAVGLGVALDRAILAKAFRGELVPQDPNDEPASVLLERLRAQREQNGKTTNGAGRRRAAAFPPPASSNTTAPERKPHASRRSQAPARSRG